MKKKVTFDEMVTLYNAWMQQPEKSVTQQDFFKPYGWSRTAFFREAYDQHLDI